MNDSKIVLTGLDGSNPLAFLAALGALRVLDYRSRHAGQRAPTLSWIDQGGWRPVIHGVSSVGGLIGELLEDKEGWADDPAFLIAYDEGGENLLDPRAGSGKVTRDLKPQPTAMRTFLEGLASEAAAERPVDALQLRRALDTAAAYGSEMVQDNNGNTKPTTFHFTAGQQQFMKAVADLQAGVTAEDMEEALVGPWRRESTLPNMGWDATNARFYALRATNPSGDKKTTIAGADWLAFIGLGSLPSFPQGAPYGTRLLTTGIVGGWKDSTFTWPLWTDPVVYRVAMSICRLPDWSRAAHEKRDSEEASDVQERQRAKRAERRALQNRLRGIGVVFSANILRSDQGGYGSFAPAEVIR